jgi:quercetin dioxygenase-like cupin family protein
MNAANTGAPQEERWFFGGAVTRILIAGDKTGHAFSLLQVTSPPERSTPIHRHDREAETIYVLDGELRIDFAHGSRTVKAGETIVLQRGEPHRIVNASQTPARSLVFCTPAGFEDFVREVGDPAAPNDEIAPPATPAIGQRMVAAAPRHGITLLKDFGSARSVAFEYANASKRAQTTPMLRGQAARE